MERRKFIQIGSWAIPIASILPSTAAALISENTSISEIDEEREIDLGGPADYTLNISSILANLAPDRVISTVGYNNEISNQVIRFKEGKRVTIDLINDTDTPEQVHWHGQFLPDTVDGSAEEGTPYVPARGKRRISFVPGPSGTRFVHTHVRAGSDLNRGAYTGQDAIVYIEAEDEKKEGYDREEFLMLKEFEPFFTNFGEEEEEGGDEHHEEEGNGKPNGLEVGYRSFCINGKTMNASESIKVKSGERILFHFVNASATENRKIALPGHSFKVVALDGNPVPNPTKVNVLELGVAERIDAIVEMDNPGSWILGVTIDEDREGGMARIIEYASHKKQESKWQKPAKSDRDYLRFGNNKTAEEPDEVIKMKFGKINGGRNGFNLWTINGKTYEDSEPGTLHYGKRYRLAFHNDTDDAHPLHLHRHSFEITSINGKKTSGIMKDVVMIGAYGKLEVDFVANHPGNTLFHCHQQLHMDYGFMYLFQYASTNEE